MKPYKIILIDDEEDITKHVVNIFSDEFDITSFTNPIKALGSIRNNRYDIFIVDYKMPEMTGLELMVETRKVYKNLHDFMIILLTAYHGDADILKAFIHNNLIQSLVEKPLDLDKLKEKIEDAIRELERMKQDKERVEILQIELEELRERSFIKLIGTDKGLKDVYKKVKSVAAHPVNVLITGETGTGKEVIADLIHLLSDRREKPIIKINCSAIPEALLEGELFGYRKGAFTGAYADKKGKIELANGGTLFLDEIGDMKPDLQVKLLRVLQEKKVEPLGSIKPVDADFRLIAATNIDLEKAIADKMFRSDLYFRLNSIPIHLPPLRERIDDIEDLVHYFIDKKCHELNIKPKKLGKDAMALFKAYKWPGNIREMENAILRALILAQTSDMILAENLSFLKPNIDKKIDEALALIAKEVIDANLDISNIEGKILNHIINFYDNNIMKAVKNTGIPKDRFYRNRRGSKKV